MHSAQTWLGLQGLGGGCRGSAGQTLVFVSDRGCLGPWAGEPGEESAQSLERSHGGSHEGGSGQGERGSGGGGGFRRHWMEARSPASNPIQPALQSFHRYVLCRMLGHQA